MRSFLLVILIDWVTDSNGINQKGIQISKGPYNHAVWQEAIYTRKNQNTVNLYINHKKNNPRLRGPHETITYIEIMIPVKDQNSNNRNKSLCQNNQNLFLIK